MRFGEYIEPGAHGPDRLYPKFTVIKNSTGKELDQSIEFLFVLRPETNDHAAIQALRWYAYYARATYPQLADEIDAQVDRILRDHPDGNPAAMENGR